MNKDQHTIAEFFYDTKQNHQLYVQVWGNEQATKRTFVFLHGGPGSGVKDGHKEYFNPETDRVVFFDQRGSGKSMPLGSLYKNKTEYLIEDIRGITQQLDIKRFYITGRSWGSCLALAYALKYPDTVEGLIIGGVFTGSKREIDYVDKGEYSAFFPEVREAFLARTPRKYHDNPAEYHYKNALNPKSKNYKKSVYAMSMQEWALCSLDDRFNPVPYEEFDPAGGAVLLNYTRNLCFMTDRYILDNAKSISAPVWIVQGRYDGVCPPITAHELHKALPNSKITWTIGGHSGSEREANTAIKTILQNL